MDIVERSEKAQETINQTVNQNEFLKHMCRWQEKEIVRLRIALERAADSLRDAHALDAWKEASKALGEKE